MSSKKRHASPFTSLSSPAPSASPSRSSPSTSHPTIPTQPVASISSKPGSGIGIGTGSSSAGDTRVDYDNDEPLYVEGSILPCLFLFFPSLRTEFSMSETIHVVVIREDGEATVERFLEINQNKVSYDLSVTHTIFCYYA